MLKILKAEEFQEVMSSRCCDHYFTCVEIQIAVDAHAEDVTNSILTKLHEDTRKR